MTYATNNIQFTDREKQLQQILKSDERFLNFLKDKDVNRKKLVDEKGRKMDIKGFVDLKRKYGLTSRDLKVEKIPKKLKKVSEIENIDKLYASATVDNIPDVNMNTCNGDDDDTNKTATVKPVLGDNKPFASNKVICNSENVTSGSPTTTESKQKKHLKLKMNVSSKAIKNLKTKQPSKTKEASTLSTGALEKFKRMMEKNLMNDRKKDEEDEEEDDAGGKIHREFTFTVSGPDTPDDDDDAEYSGNKSSDKNNKEQFKKEEVRKLSEAEKTDILLLTLDTTDVCKTNEGVNGNDKMSRSERKKAIQDEVEKEVALEDYEEILTNSRFKNLMENTMFSIDELKANAVKKRLLIRGK